MFSFIIHYVHHNTLIRKFNETFIYVSIKVTSQVIKHTELIEKVLFFLIPLICYLCAMFDDCTLSTLIVWQFAENQNNIQWLVVPVKTD